MSITQANTPQKIKLVTERGNIECLYHPGAAHTVVVWLCGALGGLDGPSFGVFRILAEQLAAEKIGSLRLHYALPGKFEECVQDTLAGIEYLNRQKYLKVALVGHSFGGAVAIQAGTMSPLVKAVVGLASQTFGAQNVGRLAPRPLLLIHGERDRNLPARCSQLIYQWAGQPKELYILKNNGHFLREAHQALITQLRQWLIDKLPGVTHI